MTPHPGRRGRGVVLRPAVLPAPQGGLRGGGGRDRPRRARGVRHDRRRPRAARPHAPGPVRRRGLPAAAPALQRAGHHADRQGQRDRQGRRASSSAPTTTSPSPTPPASCSPASRRCCAGWPSPRSCSRRPSRPARCGWTSSATSSRVSGEPVSLPLKEFELLEMLLRNAGRVLTRMQLIDRVWGSDYVGDTKTLDVHVKRLRAKIEPDPANPRAHRHRARAGLQVRGGIAHRRTTRVSRVWRVCGQPRSSSR